MSNLDDQYSFRLNDYITNQLDQYLNWYTENAKISKINLLAALVVISICALSLLLTPNTLDQMSFFKYSFNPTFAIKLGLLASIVLAFLSMFTSYKKMKSCLVSKALLQSEYALFSKYYSENPEPNNEAAFSAFVSAVDGIMAATNPELVISVLQDNTLKAKARQT